MAIKFSKMQGVGNDFVVVDGRGLQENWPEFAIAVCDRRFGIGADGVLVLCESEVADLRMRMFNPDGTEDVCGNGLRCAVRYAEKVGWITSSDLTVEVLGGVRHASISAAKLNSSSTSEIRINMEEPVFAPERIPMRVSLERVIDYPLELPDGTVLPITALSTGSTHAVTFVDELPEDAHFFSLSPQVEHHPLFPERTSLMWCKVTDPQQIAMRIWERGAGETWGCGTGACAAAVAAIVKGYVQKEEAILITVSSRGGSLHIEWSEGQPIWMQGPAEFVYAGDWPV